MCLNCCYLLLTVKSGLIVQVCWPINTLIQPGSNYSVELQAESSVLQALSWDVTNSSLQLSTNGSFRSLYPIVAIVSVTSVTAVICTPCVACRELQFRMLHVGSHSS